MNRSTMRRATLLTILTLSLLLTAFVRPAAAGPATLTNDDVLEMLAAGLGPELVIAVVEAQLGNYDVSPAALIGLRRRGVPEDILTAMARKAESGAGREIVLPDGAEVKVRLRDTVSSATASVDDPILFEVVEDVVVQGVTVIRSGAEARGKVLRAQHKKGFGRRGKLEFTIGALETIDGQKLPLRYTRSLKGKDRYNAAGVVTLLVGPFGIFVKGRDVEVPAGTEYTLYVDGERRVQLGEEAV